MVIRHNKSEYNSYRYSIFRFIDDTICCIDTPMIFIDSIYSVIDTFIWSIDSREQLFENLVIGSSTPPIFHNCVDSSYFNYIVNLTVSNCCALVLIMIL